MLGVTTVLWQFEFDQAVCCDINWYAVAVRECMAVWLDSMVVAVECCSALRLWLQ